MKGLNLIYHSRAMSLFYGKYEITKTLLNCILLDFKKNILEFYIPNKIINLCSSIKKDSIAIDTLYIMNCHAIHACLCVHRC